MSKDSEDVGFDWRIIHWIHAFRARSDEKDKHGTINHVSVECQTVALYEDRLVFIRDAEAVLLKIGRENVYHPFVSKNAEEHEEEAGDTVDDISPISKFLVSRAEHWW